MAKHPQEGPKKTDRATKPMGANTTSAQSPQMQRACFFSSAGKIRAAPLMMLPACAAPFPEWFMESSGNLGAQWRAGQCAAFLVPFPQNVKQLQGRTRTFAKKQLFPPNTTKHVPTLWGTLGNHIRTNVCGVFTFAPFATAPGAMLNQAMRRKLGGWAVWPRSDVSRTPPRP